MHFGMVANPGGLSCIDGKARTAEGKAVGIFMIRVPLSTSIESVLYSKCKRSIGPQF